MDFEDTFESETKNNRQRKISDYPVDVPSEKIHALAGILNFYGLDRDMAFYGRFSGIHDLIEKLLICFNRGYFAERFLSDRYFFCDRLSVDRHEELVDPCLGGRKSPVYFMRFFYSERGRFHLKP